MLIQCHGNYIEEKKINHRPEIDMLKKILTNIVGCPDV